jgi:hypothetical protein
MLSEPLLEGTLRPPRFQHLAASLGSAYFGNSFAEVADACAGTVPPETMNILEVLRPDGTVKTLWKDHERPVVVWPFVSTDLCGVLAVAPPLAEGAASLKFVDNNFFASGPGANSSNIHGVGKVTNVETGEQLNLRLFGGSSCSPANRSKTLGRRWTSGCSKSQTFARPSFCSAMRVGNNVTT